MPECVCVCKKAWGFTVEKDCVMICISIRGINSFKPLWKLYITYAITTTIHHKAHSLPYSHTVVEIMVTIQIEYEGPIGQYCRGSNHGVHGPCFLVMVIPWSLLSGDISKHRNPDVYTCEVQFLLIRSTHYRLKFWDLTHYLQVTNMNKISGSGMVNMNIKQ